MLTKATAIKTVKAFVAACAERQIVFSKVILFGSLAAGKAHEYSDIDVALVSDQFSGMPYKDWSLLSPVKVSNRSFSDIEPHPFPTQYFAQGDPFIDEIKKTGMVIEIKD